MTTNDIEKENIQDMNRSDTINELIDHIYKSMTDKNEEDKNRIRVVVEPLYNLADEARKKKLYLYLKIANAWLSPDEFEENIKNGYYAFSKEEWELRDPYEKLQEILVVAVEHRRIFKKALQEVAQYIQCNEDELEMCLISDTINRVAQQDKK